MCEIAAFGDFAYFHSSLCRRRAHDRSASFAVPVLLAVGLHDGRKPGVLLELDAGERVPQPLVLNHRRRADALVFVEDSVGKHDAVRAYLQPPIREVVQLHVLAAELFADRAAFPK